MASEVNVARPVEFPEPFKLEMTGRCALCSNPSMRQVVVHDLRQARAALAAAKEAGVPIELRSAPDAAAYAGVGYLEALGEAAGQELLIDCGEDAGLVMAALRAGCRNLAFSGTRELCERLADMAAQAGARLRIETSPPHVLELKPGQEAGAACRRWLEDSLRS